MGFIIGLLIGYFVIGRLWEKKEDQLTDLQNTVNELLERVTSLERVIKNDTHV